MNILQGSGWFPALEFRSSATSVAMYSLASEYPDKSMVSKCTAGING